MDEESFEELSDIEKDQNEDQSSESESESGSESDDFRIEDK